MFIVYSGECGILSVFRCYCKDLSGKDVIKYIYDDKLRLCNFLFFRRLFYLGRGIYEKFFLFFLFLDIGVGLCWCKLYYERKVGFYYWFKGIWVRVVMVIE